MVMRMSARAVLVRMVVRMVVVVMFFRPADFHCCLFQEYVSGRHVGCGLLEECGQGRRLFRLRSGSPFLEFGGMILVVLNPVGEHKPQFVERRFRFHVSPFHESVSR